MVRVGVVGVGRLGALFAETLTAHPDVDAVVLAGSRPDSAVDLAERIGARTLPSAAEVFESVDAVVIAASTSAHGELIAGAAAAGIPLFCEKPITLDLRSTDTAIERVRDAGVEMQIGFQRRFDSGYRAARDAVQSGAIGDVYAVRTASLDPFPSSESFIATSGGLFRDLVIHDFDAIRFVTGREILEVYATTSSGFPAVEVYARHNDSGIAAGTVCLSNGGVGTFTATRHNPLGLDVRMEVIGSAGSVTVGWDERADTRAVEPGLPPRGGPPHQSFLNRFDVAYRSEMHAFIDLVFGRIENPCPPESARVAFLAALAADVSAAENRPVRLSEFVEHQGSRPWASRNRPAPGGDRTIATPNPQGG